MPQAVCKALELHKGDELAYRIEGSRASLTKAGAPVQDDIFASFDEWAGDADRKAYGSL